ncbi:hypothetical protein GCM10022252_75670 [Streptosporangium oxazolinicum]|uniref:Uncharacterized protein n=1 Tax=Streptosporangium oxazolinicum TaxID=909287 RepID=A0ABP8BL16_9ACTN
MPPRKRATPPEPAPAADPVLEPVETAPAAEYDAAPLTPPDPEPAPESDPEVMFDVVSDAAPLIPPMPPVQEEELVEPVPVAPPPAQIDPDPAFLDLRFADGTPATYDEMFADPGPRYTHVVARRRISELHYPLGATTPARRLFYDEGAIVPKTEADRIRRLMPPSAAAE